MLCVASWKWSEMGISNCTHDDLRHYVNMTDRFALSGLDNKSSARKHFPKRFQGSLCNSWSKRRTALASNRCGPLSCINQSFPVYNNLRRDVVDFTTNHNEMLAQLAPPLTQRTWVCSILRSDSTGCSRAFSFLFRMSYFKRKRTNPAPAGWPHTTK